MDPLVDPVPVGWTETAPEQYVYNVPDAYEQDPEIIRAELMFFNTPQSQAFSGEAYYALKNVQDQCMADYSKFCTTSYVSFGDAQTLMEKLFTSSLPFLMSRRLRETGSASIPAGHSGRKLVEYMRSFYVPKKSEALSAAKERSSSVAQASVSMKERESKPVNGVRSHVMRGDNAKLNRAIKAEKSKKDSRRKLRSDDTFVGDALNVAPSQVVDNVAVSKEAEGVTIVTISDASESQEVPVLMIDPPMIVEDIGFVGQMPFIASHSRPAPELGYGVPMRASRFEPAVVYPTDIEPADLSSQPPAQERPPARPLPPSQDDDKDSGNDGKRPEKPLPNKPQPGDEDPGHHHPPPHRPPGRDEGSDGQEPPRPPRDGRDDHHDPHHDRDHHDHDRDHDHHHGHESDSDGESDDEGEGDHFGRHSRHRAHGRFHGLEDRFFPGSLGYGASGDMCLYDNAQNLSPPCAQAISDVYVLREQYWTSYSDAQEMGHHHHPVMGFFILGLVLVVLVKKIMYMPRRRHVHKFLTALNANPELKAQLESQLNMEIPLPKNETCCGGARQSFCRRLFFAVGYLFFAVVASLFIAVTTLEMTAGILNGMAAHADGDAPPASVPFVLFVMLTIMAAQLCLLRLIVRSVGGLWRRNCGATIDDNQPGANDDSESSASSSNSNHGNGGGVQVEFQRLTSLPVSFYREYVSPRVTSFFATRSATSEGYAPLQAGEEREMIPVGRQTVPSTHGGAQYAVYTGVPVNPHSVVQVTARPVSAVSLV